MNSRLWLLVFLLLPCPALIADQVVLSNGDKVSGALVQVDGGHVVLNSRLMGTVKLLRSDVRVIRFGTPEQIRTDIEKENMVAIEEAAKRILAGNAAANKVIANHKPGNPPNEIRAVKDAPENPLARIPAPGLGGQADEELNAALEQLNQLLPGAANRGVQNRLQGQLKQVLSGKLGLGDIRNQAAEASDQLRSAKRDLQQIGAWSPIYDMYLGILDDFVGRVEAGEGLDRK